MRNSVKTYAITSGIINILFGIALLAIPGITLRVLILIFAIYAILYGIVRLAGSIAEPQGSSRRLPWLIIGILAILAGIGIILYPSISLIILAYYFAFFFLIVGFFDLVAAFTGLRSTSAEILLIIVGLFSLIFGGYLLFNPLIGLTTLIIIAGWFAIIYGILLLIYGLSIRSIAIE